MGKTLQRKLQKLIKTMDKNKMKIKKIVINGIYHSCPHYTDFTINLINFKEN